MKTTEQRRWLCCAALLLGGCAAPAVSPPAPDAELAAQWPADLAVVVPAAPKLGAGGTAPGAKTVLPPLREADWRAFFSDPPLQRAIEQALERNRELAVALARVAEARALAGSAAAERLPNLDLAAQRAANHIPDTIDPSAHTTRRIDLNLVSSWEIDFWQRSRSLAAAARAQFLASEFALAAFRLTLIADVANAWYVLEDAQLRERVLADLLRGREASAQTVRRRAEVGLANAGEVLSAEAARETARAEWLGAQRARANAHNALRLLLGGELAGEALPPLPAPGATPTLHEFPAVAIGLPAEAILRRPDLAAAEQRLAAAQANVAAARAAFLPRITLTASAGLASRDLDDLFGGGAGAWSFVPSLRLPLFDRDKLHAGLDLAVARQDAAVADYERAIQQAFRDIADGLATARYGRAQAEAAHAAAALQAQRLAQVEARYRAGLANYPELLDAQRDQLSAVLTQSSARRQVLSAATAVFKAIGGL